MDLINSLALLLSAVVVIEGCGNSLCGLGRELREADKAAAEDGKAEEPIMQAVFGFAKSGLTKMMQEEDRASIETDDGWMTMMNTMRADISTLKANHETIKNTIVDAIDDLDKEVQSLEKNDIIPLKATVHHLLTAVDALEKANSGQVVREADKAAAEDGKAEEPIMQAASAKSGLTKMMQEEDRASIETDDGWRTLMDTMRADISTLKADHDTFKNTIVREIFDLDGEVKSLEKNDIIPLKATVHHLLTAVDALEKANSGQK